jgi:hypothetical protein
VDLIGKRLGQCQMMDLLGQGGMAPVFNAYQSTLESLVAVKVLPAQHTLIPGFSESVCRWSSRTTRTV